jgi:hypothetical protein
VLLVSYDRVDAELTGGEGVDCDAPECYLATFEIAADRVRRAPPWSDRMRFHTLSSD